MFCAPSAIDDPARDCAAAGIITAGGATMISRSRARAAASRSISARIAAISARASTAFRFIFQLPASISLRIVTVLLTLERLYAGQFAAFEELERRAASGRNMGKARGPIVSGDGGGGISAAQDRYRAGLVRERFSDR